MLVRILGLLGLAIVVFFVGTWLLQRPMMFPRRSAPPRDPALHVPGLERVDLESGVEAWLLPPRPPRKEYPVIIFAHGNAELIDDWVGQLETPRSWGVGILLVEYPGYGRSPGSPSERSITESFVAAYDALAGRDDVRASAIVGYGRSLGGGAICRLGAARELAAVILESSFTSVRPLARGLGVPGFWVRDPFDNLEFLRRYAGPVLIVHGKHDGIIGFEHAEELHRATSASQLEPVACGHNDCPRPWSRIHRFLSEAGLIEIADPAS